VSESERTDAFPARSSEADFRKHAAMPPEPPHGAPAAAGAGAPDHPLDLWLRRGLRRLHSAVLAEPIPPDLLRLVEDGPEQAPLRAEQPPSPAGPGAGFHDAQGAFERRVSERAYFLWLEEDRPEGRALEHWMLSFTRQVAREAYERRAG
jgi:hypothetical protein